MRKILVILNSKDITGAYLSIMKTCQDLQTQFEFHFALPVESNLFGLVENEGFKTVPYDPIYLSKSLENLKYLPRLRKDAQNLLTYMRSNDIDLVHVNDIYNQVGQRIKKEAPDTKLVQHVRLKKDSYIKLLYPYFAKKALKRADAVIAVSKSVQDDLPQSEKVYCIYNSIASTQLHPEYKIREGEGIVISYFGRLMPGKGQKMMLEAFNQAYQKNPNIKLQFVGGLPEDLEFGRDLMAWSQTNDLEKVVSFHDFTEDVEGLMKGSDLVVNFSVSESFSRVCLEALMYGVPLISSDCGGPAELFEHNKSGILVPNKDVNRLSEAVLRLSDDSDLRKRFSEAGKKYVHEKFSRENTSEKLALLYKKLLKT